MATSKKKKKEQQRRRRQQKKREALKRRRELHPEGAIVDTGLSRRLSHLTEQAPQPWENEPPEDVAIFDDAALESLSAELAEQAVAIRSALEHATHSRGNEAMESISSIPRSSSFAQWRLFVRGLVAWLAEDTQAAEDAWKRLDFDRRAGRIAISMMASLRSDLEEVSLHSLKNEAPNSSSMNWSSQVDEALLRQARLLRQVRFERPALRLARIGVKAEESGDDLLLGQSKIEWLKSFSEDYRSSEPELVAALQQAALLRAYSQTYADLFEYAIKTFRGPPHDPNNHLLASLYHSTFDDAQSDQQARRSLQIYLTKDLPANEQISPALRDAIASQIHLEEARMKMRPKLRGILARLVEEEDTKEITKELKASVKAYPANRDAYITHVEWIESELDDDRLTKKQQAPLLKRLAKVMQAWANGLPDDVKPRIWLVDYLLENEEMAAAKKHVRYFADSRHDDPLVRAAGWKWQLLEAMRLCRRKTLLDKVRPRLEDAELLWPAWLSKDWLPYLRAAWALRCGALAKCKQLQGEICEDSSRSMVSLPNACLMLGAAQRMRVPSADLKPLRAPVDAAVKDLANIPYDELLAAGACFWDLQRTGLLYPAYRMHGGKFVGELLARWDRQPSLVADHVDNASVQSAVFWCSEHKFAIQGYEYKPPGWFQAANLNEHPMFAAANLNCYLKFRYGWRGDQMAPVAEFVRKSAASQNDAYYRHWFTSLADDFDEMQSRLSSRRFGFPDEIFQAFANMSKFGKDFGDLNFSNEEDLDFDPDCDCESCRAAKAAYEARRE